MQSLARWLHSAEAGEQYWWGRRIPDGGYGTLFWFGSRWEFLQQWLEFVRSIKVDCGIPLEKIVQLHIEKKVTKLLRETTQVMLLCRMMDFYLGWWNYPKAYWRKIVGERGWDTWFCNPHDFVDERRRLAASTGPNLKGEFGESFKNIWSGGPYKKVLSIFQIRGREWIVRYDFSWTNFEILISTLSDITATAISKSSNTCTLILQVVFLQNGQYTNVMQSRIKVYLNARTCIYFLCFARVKKDDYVTL